MRKSTTAALGLVGLVAGGLLAGGAAFAQGAEGQQDRVIRVPPGAVVLVLPAGTPVDALANPVNDATDIAAAINRSEQWAIGHAGRRQPQCVPGHLHMSDSAL